MIIDDLITVSKSRFEYEAKADEKLKDYYNKALDENRLQFLCRNNECIGYIVFFIFTKGQLEERLKNDGTFNYPIHTASGDYLYIDNCIIFKENSINLLYLRNFLRKKFPQIKVVCWHKTLKGGKKLFKINYDGGYV